MNKVFALTGVTALAGIVMASAGATACGSDEVDSSTPDSGPDARNKPDAKQPPEEEEPPGKCYKDDAIDVSGLTYKPPRLLPGSCTPEVFTKTIKPIFGDGEEPTFDALREALQEGESAKCADCVFGPDGDTWAPIVADGDQVLLLNLAGCIQIKSESKECGEAVFKWDMCLRKACADCSGEEASDCFSAVHKTACGEPSKQVVSACGGGSKVNSYFKACDDADKYSISGIGGAIDEMCVGPERDDAGP